MPGSRSANAAAAFAASSLIVPSLTCAADARAELDIHVLKDGWTDASPADIEKGLQGNICRCGTYEQMRDAIYALCNQKRS